eukprot:11018843-Alexandrium_andersonii.AAC.1
MLPSQRSSFGKAKYPKQCCGVCQTRSPPWMARAQSDIVAAFSTLRPTSSISDAMLFVCEALKPDGLVLRAQPPADAHVL